MPRVPPFDRSATYEDLAQLPDQFLGEIIDGELHANPRPGRRVAGSTIALGGMLIRGLDRGGAAGSWQVVPQPELRLGDDILVPGLAAWRLSRLPGLPATPYFTVAPDWVCETPSSYTASLRARRMSIFAAVGVSHAWLIDPVARTLEVRRMEGGRWTLETTQVGDAVVRAEPFEGLELQLGALWP